MSKSLFSRQGGKQKLFPVILPYFPESFETYVEPFVGAGHIVVNANIPDSTQIILNDLNTNIYQMWKDIREISQEDFLSYINFDATHVEFNNYRDDPIPEDCYDRFRRNMILQKQSFGANFSYYNTGNHHRLFHCNSNRNLSRFIATKKIAERSLLFQYDYSNILELYDSPNTFFYLDPPYYETNNTCYGTPSFKHRYVELKNILSQLSGKWLLSINNDPFITDLFSGYNIIELELSYSIGTDKSLKKELLIKNF